MIVPALVLVFGLIIALVVVCGLSRARQQSRRWQLESRARKASGKKQGLLPAFLSPRLR